MSTLKKGRPRATKPPAKSGVYRIVEKETGKIKYIGETDNLDKRKGQHFRTD